jgi:hypothetical protein
MNIVQLQDQLKNFSQDQLVREMQMPSGSAPQFLVLGEILRRQKMQQDFTAQQAKGDRGTVAQEAVAAAGVPQGGIADMARAMAPSTDMTQNTGVQAMYAGGPVKKMAKGDKVVRGGVVYIEQEDGTYLREDGGDRAPRLSYEDGTQFDPITGVPLTGGAIPGEVVSPSAPIPEVAKARAAGLESFTVGDVLSDYGITFGGDGAKAVPPGAGRIPVRTPTPVEPPAPSRADRDQQGAAAVPTPAEVAEAEKAAEEKAAQDALLADKTPPGGTTPSGGAGGAGGVSSYEQALMDALANREKAANQDKWLALAQVGLNLMASRQPTLGGAIGEAGLKGVEAARTARDTYDKEKLEILGAIEQSRAARAKAASRGASGGLSGIKLSQYLPQLRYAADAAADRVSLLTGGMDPNMAISMATKEGDNARVVEIKNAYDAALQANSDYINFVRTIGDLEGFAPEEDDTSFSARE